jgi:diacylglycerol kinase (ATP)
MAAPTIAEANDATRIEEKPAPAGRDDGKCVTVVFNPVSGQGDPQERKARIEEALAQHGYRCQHLVTTPEQGARFHAEQALTDGVDLLGVSGGDGTVVETMSALIGTRVPLAIFPAGTGNLLSVNLNLPKEVPQAVHAALFGRKRALDLARITLEGGESKLFAIMAGAGYDAKVIEDADREAKNKLGMVAYLWAAVRNLGRGSVPIRVWLDDAARPLRRRVKSVMVANMGRLQGGVDLVPDAWPDDGRLQVTLLKAETLGDWLRLIWNAARRTLHEEPAIEYHAAKKVRVAFPVPQPVQFDGEDAGRVRSFTVEIVPSAVQVMVPEDAPV